MTQKGKSQVWYISDAKQKDLTNIVKSPTRISNQSSSLINVMIINNTENETFTVNQNLGYSDHLAQLLYIKPKNPIEGPISRYKRLFAEKTLRNSNTHFIKKTGMR